ncbi:MAG: hypothetical protein ACRC31_05375, partial [Cetobacterium sp.]
VTIDQKLVNSVSTKINTDFFIQPVNKKSKKKMIRIPKRFQYLIDGESDRSLTDLQIAHGIDCVTKIMILRNKMTESLKKNDSIEFIKNLMNIIYIYIIY